MKVKFIRENDFLRAALGAALAVICGLALWKLPVGEPWVDASYDYLFRFGSHAVTNKVVVILMDNDAYDHLNQIRGQPWDRALHAELLNKLANDGCALVVFDSFFKHPRDPAKDEALANGMRRQRGVVLATEQAQVTHPDLAGARPTLPSEPFLGAAGTNWGVAWLDPDLDSIVRRHWPFPAPGPYPSLPWTVARLAGAQLSSNTQEQWIRYYGRDGAWPRMSYRFAMTQPTNYFRDQIVFIGSQPKTSVADAEPDEFLTPYSRWTGETTGGVEIMLAAFLNLANNDWLQRPAWWLEALVLAATGILLGGGLCQLRPLVAFASAVGIAVLVAVAAISCSYFTNYWFPWLVIAGGQLPCAMAWAVTMPKVRARETVDEAAISKHVARAIASRGNVNILEDLPDTPDYELVNPPFGRGSYGKVWLARNAVGQWQALKVIYLANFDQNTGPYEREFNGISRYKPISDKHPGLLRVDFVSRKRPEYFYYVMELGDPLEPGWEREPSTYKPRDLVNERHRADGRKLPVHECLRIGLGLSDALDFLHRQGLTHRDIKPQNIIYVNGQPKLADVGLISEIGTPDKTRTLVGTPGYMPPPPELPGTPQADIYALGMVLYVLSTGQNASFFPEISTTLVETKDQRHFFPLNDIILKACQPDRKQRYASAAEMHLALQHAGKVLESGTTGETGLA